MRQTLLAYGVELLHHTGRMCWQINVFSQIGLSKTTTTKVANNLVMPSKYCV